MLDRLIIWKRSKSARCWCFFTKVQLKRLFVDTLFDKLAFCYSPNRRNAVFSKKKYHFKVKRACHFQIWGVEGLCMLKEVLKWPKKSCIIIGQHLKLQILYQLNCLLCLYHLKTTKIILALQLYWCFFKNPVCWSVKKVCLNPFVDQSRMSVLCKLS